jgi:hypothetical protein
MNAPLIENPRNVSGKNLNSLDLDVGVVFFIDLVLVGFVYKETG